MSLCSQSHIVSHKNLILHRTLIIIFWNLNKTLWPNKDDYSSDNGWKFTRWAKSGLEILLFWLVQSHPPWTLLNMWNLISKINCSELSTFFFSFQCDIQKKENLVKRKVKMLGIWIVLFIWIVQGSTGSENCHVEKARSSLVCRHAPNFQDISTALNENVV